MQNTTRIEEITSRLVSLSPKIRCFYDVNLRPNQWSLPLVHRLLHLSSVVKLNEDEARTLAKLGGAAAGAFALKSFCSDLAILFDIEVVCVTLGKDGCYIYANGSEVQVCGYWTRDAFSAALLHGFEQDWSMVKTAQFANAVGSVVASRPGATPSWSIDDALALCRPHGGEDRHP